MGAYQSNAQDYDEKYLHFVKILDIDLKIPLTTIKGYSDLLLTEDYGPLQESQLEFVEKINRSVMRAYSSLATFQKLATIESGILLVKQEPVNLVQIINEIINQLPELDSPHHTFQIKIPNNLPTVKARFFEVYEIISWLIENSIKNSLPGAQILVFTLPETNSVKTIISSSCIKPSTENEPEGRDPFEFMQSKIIQQYIEQFGGDFGEEHEEGKGSTVWFTLPIADEQTDI